MFFTSLITPLILLVLYVIFLGNVYEETFRASLKSMGTTVSDKLIGGCAGGQLASSLLAVCCVTVAFCSNFLMVQDKVSGARQDLTMAPVGRGTLALGYYIANLLSTLLVCLCAAAICLLYLSRTDWYLTGTDVVLLLLDIVRFAEHTDWEKEVKKNTQCTIGGICKIKNLKLIMSQRNMGLSL